MAATIIVILFVLIILLLSFSHLKVALNLLDNLVAEPLMIGDIVVLLLKANVYRRSKSIVYMGIASFPYINHGKKTQRPTFFVQAKKMVGLSLMLP